MSKTAFEMNYCKQNKRERERECKEMKKNGMVNAETLRFHIHLKMGLFSKFKRLSTYLYYRECSIQLIAQYFGSSTRLRSRSFILSLVPIDHHFNTGIITLMDFNGNSLSIQTINRSI